jgi:hypothetical protein
MTIRAPMPPEEAWPSGRYLSVGDISAFCIKCEFDILVFVFGLNLVYTSSVPIIHCEDIGSHAKLIHLTNIKYFQPTELGIMGLPR